MRRATRVLAAGLIAGALSVPACTWKSRVPRGRPIALPDTAPRELRSLRLCEPVRAVLDCEAREPECNHWYRLGVEQPGELRVRVELGEPEGEGRLTRLVVRPIGKPVVAQQMSNQGEDLSVAVRVTPDLYGVLVQGGGARRSYRLEARLAADGGPAEGSCPVPAAETPAGE